MLIEAKNQIVHRIRPNSTYLIGKLANQTLMFDEIQAKHQNELIHLDQWLLGLFRPKSIDHQNNLLFEQDISGSLWLVGHIDFVFFFYFP